MIFISCFLLFLLPYHHHNKEVTKEKLLLSVTLSKCLILQIKIEQVS